MSKMISNLPVIDVDGTDAITHYPTLFPNIPGTFDLARQTLGRTRMPPGRDIDMNMSVLTNQVQGLDGVSRFGG